MIYFDTSALVKRYVFENGSQMVDEIIENIVSLATSKLTYPEMLSAFARRHREGEYSKDWLDRIIENFHIELANFIVIELQNELRPKVKSLIFKHPLRGADAVHLASAVWLKNSTAENITFVASDMNLLKAAEMEGLHIMNPDVEKGA